MIRKWPFLFLMSIFVLAGALPAEATSSTEIERKIRTEEKRLEQIESQVAYHQRKISESRKREKGLLDELNEYDQKAAVTAQKVRVLELKEKQAIERLQELESDIRTTRKEMDRVGDLLADRLVSLYKYGNSAGLDLILSAGDVKEAMNMGYLLQRVAEQDETFFRSLEARKGKLDTAMAESERQKKLLAERKEALLAERRAYSDASRQRSSSLEQIRLQEEKHKKAAQELQQTQQELERSIRRLLEEKQRLAQSRKAERQPLVPPKAGRLAWPVSGRVTSRFGTRIHPQFKTKSMHTGIDIAAPSGTPVKAAAAGEVLFAGWLRGYGQIVILDHGGSLTTVYAHLSRMGVREGQRVSAGYIIGNVGSTGVATGPHLHFEVRDGGNAKDPLHFLGAH